MSKLLLKTALLSSISFGAVAQTADSLNYKALEEVVVKATRASAKSGMAFTNVSKATIEKRNLGQDIPILLDLTPSVVTTSDAGAGIGYTGIRIRGTDPTRINVTINGIPYNDSESQGVFWVNMPDISSSVSSIQVQRGVGTSTNGAGAFGASINVNTMQYEQEPFAEINTTVGSFNTIKTNVQASTGLMNNHFVVDARLSRITSDGWVERASSNLQSFYLSGGYYDKQNFVRLNIFSGKEITYQSWYGTPEALVKGDLAGVDAFVERNFLGEDFRQRMLSEGRQFNWYTYDNEVDNYQQDHYQLVSSFKLGDNWRLNPSLHYTRGLGHFEQFRPSDDLVDYGLSPVQISGEEIGSSDLIRRKWLDNHFYGAVWSLEYDNKNRVLATLGGGLNKYIGDHYGTVIWSRFASNSEKGYRWYENRGEKVDFNLYGKTTVDLTKNLSTYVDMQVRTVTIGVDGILDDRTSAFVDENYTFFNPKLGLTKEFSSNSSAYVSFAVANKEPSRQDFIDNPGGAPRPERLNDLEAGYKVMKKDKFFEANFYHMNYKDQLVLTGAVNDVGNAIRINVPNSHRTGIELQGGASLGSLLQVAANATFSQNRVQQFTELIPSFDGTPDVITEFENTDIAFSPSVIAGAAINLLPTKGLEISLMPKFVGRQYLDNTSNKSRSLDPFFVNNLSINYEFDTKLFKSLRLSLLVNNLFNEQYSPNGYTYSYKVGEVITENFLYPQAGTNFLSAIEIRF